jgi:DNA-binding transcriptional ArsR family regulator
VIKSPMVETQPLDQELLLRASHTYRVLSHAVRLRVVELLMEEQLAVCELAAKLDLPPATLSQHLNLLRTNGVVAGERRGNRIFYKVVSPQAHAMINCLREYGDRI